MTVNIDRNGIINIKAETQIEAFALSEIIKKWNTPEKIKQSILIETNITAENINNKL